MAWANVEKLHRHSERLHTGGRGRGGDQGRPKKVVDAGEDIHASKRDSDDGIDQLDPHERLPVFKPIYASQAQRAKPSAVLQDDVSEEAMLELMRTVVGSSQQAG